MKKIVLSASMLDNKFMDVLEKEVMNLCEESGMPFVDAMEKIPEVSDIPSLNELLESLFPGEIKVVY